MPTLSAGYTCSIEGCDAPAPTDDQVCFMYLTHTGFVHSSQMLRNDFPFWGQLGSIDVSCVGHAAYRRIDSGLYRVMH